MSSHVTIFALACALGAAGCTATFTPAEPVVTYYPAEAFGRVTVVPSDIWSYPRVYFNGNWNYLVNGYWYVNTPRGWVFYRREPVELGRERTRIYAAPRRVLPPGTYPAYPREPLREPYEYNRERTPR